MSQQSRQPGNTRVEEDVRTEGGEGTSKVDATPPIGDDAVKGKTTNPAPSDDASKAGGEPSEEAKNPHP